MKPLTLTEEARRALLAADWPESSLLPDALGAASLSPRWSVVLTWSDYGAHRGEHWAACVQFACVTVAIRTGRTAERALSAAMVAAARRVQQATALEAEDAPTQPRQPRTAAPRTTPRRARAGARRAGRATC